MAHQNSLPGFIQLLVATQGALGLVTISRNGREFTALEIHRRQGLYYGITWDQARYYVVARGAPTNLLTGVKGTGGYCVFEDMPAPIQRSGGGTENGAHQILYNGTLWVTDTLAGRLARYDPASQLWGDPVGWGGNKARHLNSVWGTGADLWVVEHTKQTPYKYLRRLGSGPYDFYTPEEAMQITLHRPELHQGPLQSGLHNVYRERETVYTLGPAHVLAYDLLTNRLEIQELEEVKPGKHYLRGLARILDPWASEGLETGEGLDFFIIGRSNAERRKDRDHGESALLFFTRHWRLLQKYDLPEAWGQVMEIRALTHTDRAHNGMTPPHQRQGQRWGFKTWEPT